jgi:hypothetical protein
MASIAQKQLFCWEDIEEKGDLVRLSLVLNALPDETLILKFPKFVHSPIKSLI